MRCGRLFEGTPAQMHASLSKLADLPLRHCLCGHEYTLANLRFADAADREILCSRNAGSPTRALDRGMPTLPSTSQSSAPPIFPARQRRALVASASRYADAPQNPVEVFAALTEMEGRV